MINVHVTGAARVEKNLQGIAARLPATLALALASEAQAILAASQRFVPEETSLSPWFQPSTAGTLRESGRVTPVTSSLRGHSVSILYGGAGTGASAYAIAVHEHLSPASPPSWQAAEANKHALDTKRTASKRRGAVKFYKPGTGPKYLERPFKQRVTGLFERIGKMLNQRVLRGG